MHRIEYGTSDPSLTMLLRIARACGVPLAHLVRE
ncbi:helix-turn-helix transcriptional regulator [Streptomyces sp. NPDC002138]